MGTSEQIWGLGHSLMDFVVPKCVVVKRMPLLGTSVWKPLHLSLQLFYKSKQNSSEIFFLKKSKQNRAKKPKAHFACEGDLGSAGIGLLVMTTQSIWTLCMGQ